MKKIILIQTVLLLGCNILFAQTKKSETEVPFPRFRIKAAPDGEAIVSRNPAPLLWPVHQGKETKYKIRLSQNKLFPSDDTLFSDTIPWAMYTPSYPLSSGIWYWQYAIIISGREPKWSDTFSFKITDAAKVFDTPTIAGFIETVLSMPLPRMMVSKQDLSTFILRNTGTPDAMEVLKAADKNLNRPLIPEAPTRPRDTVGIIGWEKDVLMRFMYHRFGELVRVPIENQALAYLLTSDTKYAREAIRQAIHIAGMDCRGWATSEDFNSASVMLAMATAWDVGKHLMSDDEKRTLKQAIAERGNYFFRHYCNKFEAQSMDNHVWQHTLRRLFFTSLAMAADIPEAKQWLAYTYEVWRCRFPILGGNDGGWHDGNSYYPVNFETFILFPLRLKQLTGVDFFDIPWYHNAPYFLIYSFPYKSFSTGFGDGYEEMTSPTPMYAAYSDALARETGNGYARFYADRNGGNNKPASAFRLYRLLTTTKADDVAPLSFDSLPSAHCFPDAGFAIMHSNLSDTENNLMATFMSVPFGSTGHAHAAHNGFTISYGGEELFSGSGYYSNFNDPHTLMHYRTRGHNTILVDGMAQVIGENGFGRIIDFQHNNKKTTVVGDATHAYGTMTSEFWLDRMRKSNVAYTLENGFGDPGVTKFIRRFEFIPPDRINIHDELEASEPRIWTWLLNSYQTMSAVQEGDTVIILGENRKVKARVSITSSCQLKATVSDRFFSPAINWKQRKKGDRILEYNNHWHSEVITTERRKSIRFSTEIELTPILNDANYISASTPMPTTHEQK